MHSDTHRYFLFFFICAPSVKISVHPWLLSGKKTEQTHSIGKLMRKNGGKEQNGLRKYSVCAAARAANVYNYKHKPRIAGEPAFSISRFRDWKPFFSAGTNCYAFCPCMPCFDTKYTLCGRPKGVRYQIRTTVDFSGPLAGSLFLLSHN